MEALTKVALVLVIIGGLNWLMVGLAQFDVVAAIFGAGSIVSRTIYVVVGISALICLKFFTYPTTSVRQSHETPRAV